MVTPVAVIAHTHGCHTAACDKRVGRAWWKRHHPRVRAYGLRQAVASWFNDAGGTACGTHYTFGVANKELPCGTHVRICRNGCVVAVVEDRGPFVGGRLFDLNATAAQAVGLTAVGVGTVRYAITP